MTDALWIEEEGTGPLMAVAIHAGHEVRGEFLPLLALDDAVPSREEDASTDYWARVAPTWLVPTQSRLETDLNRHRSESIYTSPEPAWGLRLWNGLIEAIRDAIQSTVPGLLAELSSRPEPSHAPPGAQPERDGAHG